MSNHSIHCKTVLVFCILESANCKVVHIGKTRRLVGHQYSICHRNANYPVAIETIGISLI